MTNKIVFLSEKTHRQIASKNPCTVIKSQIFSGFSAVTCDVARKLPDNSTSSFFFRNAFFVAAHAS